MKHAIFISFDDRHFLYAKSCLRSLEQNYPTHPDILALYDGENPEVFAFLKGIQKIIICPPSHLKLLNLKDINLGVVNSPQVFNRYILWTTQFDDYENILHLDVDVLILKPLDELFEKNDFFAVCDFSPTYSIFKNTCQDLAKVKQMLLNDHIHLQDYPFDMLNAGVFMIPKRFRNKRHFKHLWTITEKYNDFMMFADQSAISLWCHQNKIHFSADIRFNFQLSFLSYPEVYYKLIMKDIEILDDIHILHFARYKLESHHFKRLSRLFYSLTCITNLHKSYTG